MGSSGERYDVLVCGGGIAGVAAALQAARAGQRTALLEKTILLGGLATAGLIWAYPPLCDANGNKVTAGLAEELLQLACRYGPGVSDPARLGRTWTIFSPAAFILGLDEALLDAGVEIWLDTLVCRPVMDGDRIAGIEAETKAGRIMFAARAVIDATGDADIAHRSGAACVEAGNLMAMWALQASLAAARQAVEKQDAAKVMEMLTLGDSLLDREAWATAKTWTGLDARNVTAFVLAGRRLLREQIAKAQSVGSPSDPCPLLLPALAQFRTTRRIVGRATIAAGEHDRPRTDSIGLVADWREPERVWEIPYGALVPDSVRGLLVAGRCIAAEEDPWEAVRVITPVAVTGQAAGMAAALAAAKGLSPGDVPADAIQAQLAAQNIPVHRSAVGRL
ncbi:MAG: FAD-dependent oxidoreductase [Armatimonadota bacterium]